MKSQINITHNMKIEKPTAKNERIYSAVSNMLREPFKVKRNMLIVWATVGEAVLAKMTIQYNTIQ